RCWAKCIRSGTTNGEAHAGWEFAVKEPSGSGSVASRRDKEQALRSPLANEGGQGGNLASCTVRTVRYHHDRIGRHAFMLEDRRYPLGRSQKRNAKASDLVIHPVGYPAGNN